MGSIKGQSRTNMIHSNVPAKYWDESMALSTVQENVTRPYKKGSTITQFERHYGKSFPLDLLKPFGCWCKIHLGKDRVSDGSGSQRGRAGISLGFAFHKGYAAYQILHPDTGKISKVPFNQVIFDKSYFPYRNPTGQRWLPMHFRDEEEDIELGEPGELMEREDEEPFVLKSVRTRSQKAALDAQNKASAVVPDEGAFIGPVKRPASPELTDADRAEMI
eukprot:3932539-Rhodomonas_salina.1